jgi:hypothetical protein
MSDPAAGSDDNRGVPGHYFPDEEPDLEDFFSQIVPPPPPTDRPGGVVFMAPFDPALDFWFAYLRRGDQVELVEGTLEEVHEWARAQGVAERWTFVSERSAYVPMMD